MRFKKGCKVEVLSKEEVSTGAWICAELISGNGHTYNVKYGWFPKFSEARVERVPRKLIRPCPPPVEGMDNWVRRDLVEVFHNLSWKTAVVMKVMGGNNYFVRLLGLLKEFVVHKSHLRVRQSWQDGKWSVVGKGFQNCTTLMGKGHDDTRIKLCARDDCSPVKKNIEIQKPCVVSARKVKRGSSFGLFNVDAQKSRVIEKDGIRQRMLLGHPSPASEKVDELASPQENYGHSSFPTERFSKTDACRGNDSSFVGTSISVNTDSCASSVGSCSATGNGVHNLPFRLITDQSKRVQEYSSDAESCCGRGYEEEGCSLLTNEEFGADVHRSELHSYHCAIKALYVFGPMSWEEEDKVTNLRRALHVSDDEHLMVIRNLLYADK